MLFRWTMSSMYQVSIVPLEHQSYEAQSATHSLWVLLITGIFICSTELHCCPKTIAYHMDDSSHTVTQVTWGHTLYIHCPAAPNNSILQCSAVSESYRANQYISASEAIIVLFVNSKAWMDNHGTKIWGVNTQNHFGLKLLSGNCKWK